MWKKEYPEEVGWYWCYGNFAYNELRHTVAEWKAKFRMTPVEVRKVGNGFMYVGMGTFLFPKEWTGFWTPMKVPNVPHTQMEEL